MLNAFLFMVAASIGIGVGWVMRGQFGAPVAPENGIANEGDSPSDQDTDFSRQMIEGVTSLTHQVATNVGQHSSRVQTINDDLRVGTGPEAVYTAVERLIECNKVLQKQLETAEERLHNQAKMLESQAHEASVDPLTTVYNRRRFDSEMESCHAAMAASGDEAALILLDIDSFKLLNDKHGHQAGDEVLREIGAILLRLQDDDCMVARYGGEEFAVVIRNADLEAASSITESLRQEVAEHPFQYDGSQLTVTASFGLAQLQRSESVESLIGRADKALYKSKRGGRNTGHFHDGTEIHPIQRKFVLDDEDCLSPDPPMGEPAGDTRDAEDDTDQADELPKRMTFVLECTRQVAESQESDQPLSIALLRVPGANSGDVLFETAAKLREELPDDCMLAQYTSDTLGICLRETPLAGAITTARKLAQKTTGHLGVDAPKLAIGVAHAVPGDKAELLLRRADTASEASSKDKQELVWFHDGDLCAPAPEAVPAS